MIYCPYINFSKEMEIKRMDQQVIFFINTKIQNNMSPQNATFLNTHVGFKNLLYRSTRLNAILNYFTVECALK